MRTFTWVCLFVSLASLSAHAASLRVAADGLDSAACGPPAAPCRSINRAIANAASGDVILVYPGRYFRPIETPAPGCANSCVVLVNKSVRIESVYGAGGTVIDAAGVIEDVVEIAADGVTFGRRDRGFTLTGGDVNGLFIGAGVAGAEVAANHASGNAKDGFDIRGTGHRVRYNRAFDNDSDGFVVEASNSKLELNEAMRNGADGFALDFTSMNNELERNSAIDNGEDGFEIEGDGHIFDANVSTSNGTDGFNVTGCDSKFHRNSAIGNTSNGFDVDGDDHEMIHNSALGNGSSGIVIRDEDITVTRNNTFSNDDGGANCGIENASGDPIDAPQNFWGAPGGPAANPADTTCGGDPIDTAPPAASDFGQPFSVLPVL